MTTPVTPIASLPARNSAEYKDAVEALFASKIQTMISEFNVAISALNFNSTNGASSSSVAVGTGSKSFIASTGKSWLRSMTLKIGYDANNWMLGEISSYDSGTGALEMVIRQKLGSGTYNDWAISLAPSAPEGSMVFLSSIEANASAQVDIENTFDEYDIYRIIGTGIYDDTAASKGLWMRFKVSGAYDTGTTYQGNTDTKIIVTSDYANPGSHLGFTMDIFSPSMARATIASLLVNPYGGAGATTVFGNHSAASPLQGIRFYPSTGTIYAGKFLLYGIKNA